MGEKRNLLILFVVAMAMQLLLLKYYSVGSAAIKPIDLDMLPNQPNQPTPIEIVPLDAKDYQTMIHRQIIEVAPGPDEEPSPDAKYLASRSMRAARETMARPSPGSGVGGQAGPPISSQDLFKPGTQDGKTGKPEPKGEIDPISPSMKYLMKDQVRGSEISGGGGGAKDFLDGAAWGDITLANTFKFQYAYFFYQLRDSIRFYWNPDPALHLIPQSSGDLDTRVRFTLNQDGLLMDVEVLTSSGYQVVDRAAVEAIRSATPVFNVPQDLLDQNRLLVLVCSFRVLRGE